MDFNINMHFNVGVAIKVGTDGAIMLNNLHYWIIKNRANRKHYYDGRYWTYNTLDAFVELFPFWSKRQVERILNNLKKDGYIETGNYNKLAYDRTKWYTLTEKGWMLMSPNCDISNINISPNSDIENTKQGNENHDSVTPIPNQKPNMKERKKQETYNDIISSYTEDDSLKDALVEFIKMRKNIKSPMTNRALKLLLTNLDKLAKDNNDLKVKILDNSILNNWKGVYALKEEPFKNSQSEKGQRPKYDKNGFEIEY